MHFTRLRCELNMCFSRHAAYQCLWVLLFTSKPPCCQSASSKHQRRLQRKSSWLYEACLLIGNTKYLFTVLECADTPFVPSLALSLKVSPRRLFLDEKFSSPHYHRFFMCFPFWLFYELRHLMFRPLWMGVNKNVALPSEAVKGHESIPSPFQSLFFALTYTLITQCSVFLNTNTWSNDSWSMPIRQSSLRTLLPTIKLGEMETVCKMASTWKWFVASTPICKPNSRREIESSLLSPNLSLALLPHLLEKFAETITKDGECSLLWPIKTR